MNHSHQYYQSTMMLRRFYGQILVVFQSPGKDFPLHALILFKTAGLISLRDQGLIPFQGVILWL